LSFLCLCFLPFLRLFQVCFGMASQGGLTSDSSTISWQLLGKPVNPNCLAALLGHNSRKLYRAVQGAPDVRSCVPKPTSMKFASSNAFFLTTYNSVSETLPDGRRPQTTAGVVSMSEAALCQACADRQGISTRRAVFKRLQQRRRFGVGLRRRISWAWGT
jgi:hypothetical protein